MCGISGIFHPNGQSVDPNLLQRMNATLTHRGPDGEGYFTDGPVGLAMRRLAIIDLQTGDQPIFNEDRSIAIVFNGEIYNYRELTELTELRGHRYRTQSDTETIVHLYEEFGTDCVKHLNGMFAFAIYDRRPPTADRSHLFLARDHLGIKPLYYTRDSQFAIRQPTRGRTQSASFLFASELKALLTTGLVSRELDPIALDQYLAMRYVPAPRTIYRDMRKLPAGHWLRVEDGEVTVQRYWDFGFQAEDGISEEEWAARVRALLAEAVTMQMVSDVSLGAFLSGGLDSSAIVGLMSQATSEPVKTFSVTFRGWPGFDEAPHARLVADHFGTDHHEIQVEADTAELLPLVAHHCDEPMADPVAIPTYLMSKAAQERVTVVLTGEGADELFAGYGWYGWREPWPLPGSLRHLALTGVKRAFHGRRGRRTLMARLLPTFEQVYFETIACSIFQREERKALYSGDMRAALAGHELEDDFTAELEKTVAYPWQSRVQYLDTAIWLEGDPLVKADRMSMAASLEARVPFLDHRLVELAARIPPSLKMHAGQSKYILRRALADLLPAEILARRKQAFTIPVARWLRTDLRHLTQSLADHPAIARSGYFDPAVVRRLAEEHLAGRDHSAGLWALIVFAAWYEGVWGEA